ncbi:electron transfer flavoprotein subunit alpha/FixB family protein [Segetibacter sp. 3557_3]|uniref:electron transfer flavoprotein subunit alpha/FixB family protein n=1 Tax=Segetibacter sp. 3557_3 TaxID=2547429 RepID=UPI00105869C0|nr:electron transfer flavoprotein subunit alpha/FixB family protein [Segetibacter sp. 3557_3]TDH29285.1 electron transfer flavoprotein subunit alpha/FixB family protein [Segetibacter sp. 3557_3]
MAVLIFADQAEGHIKKATYEALSYGAKIAELTGTTAEAVVLGSVSDDLGALGQYGVKKVYHVANEALNHLDAQVYTKALAEVVQQSGATVLVFAHNLTARAIAPRLSARLKAGLVAGAVGLPDTTNGFVVKKNVFSGKAYAFVKLNTDIKIVSLNPNAYKAVAGTGVAEVVPTTITVDSPKVKVTSSDKVAGEVPLTEATVVVSGGRGLKGPENWGIVEDLAKAMGAATACSRPVADSNWRPHHEHVGQTGEAISPNLYVALGISGAIQHLAGVNRSKVIVVINKDAEAPFFKAADYGIVGDIFEIVPKLTEEVKKLKGIA